MKLLVIPTTDWTGHPVPNRLNFIFDRLASEHEIDVCHFKIFEKKFRDTNCNLIPVYDGVGQNIAKYYLRGFPKYSHKIKTIANDYDGIVASNLTPSLTASLQDVPVVIDYLDHFPESAAVYFDTPLDLIVKITASLISDINLGKCKGIITPTDRFKEYLKTKTDCDIAVVPNGVDRKIMKPVESSHVKKENQLGYPVIGYVGSIERWLNLEGIIKLFPCILDRYPDASLLIVGPSLHTGHKEELMRCAEKEGVSDNVIFTGRIPYENLAEYISSMDVGLNPRRQMEMNRLTMGSKILNYLACGVPVLTTNMPTVEENFSPSQGVYSYDDESEMLAELHVALSGKVNINVVKRYDWDVLARKYGKILEKILGI